MQASDVRASFERYYRNGAEPAPYYDGILGTAACKRDPGHCDLSQGIVTDDRAGSVTFHLVAADPEFLYKLALPFASVLPAGTPAKLSSGNAAPATGPYVISTYRPGHELTLVRNLHFHQWSQAAQPDGYPDRIAVAIDPTTRADDEIRAVTGGRADLVSTLWLGGTPSPSALQSTISRYASQVHSNPLPQTFGLFLNTRLPPFNRLDVRRAFDLAVDRSAQVRRDGGPILAVPTCQVLPPDFPGYRPYCPYTAGGTTSGKWTAPDLARARALVARSGTRGMRVTVWVDNYTENVGPGTATLLRSLGYRPSIKTVQNGKGFIYFGVVGDSRNKVQIGIWGWAADYAAASDFFGGFTCASFVPNSRNNPNAAGFCDPRVDRQIKRALALEASDPQAADVLWQRVDKAVVDQAPVIPLDNQKAVDVVSKRVGNYQYSGNGFGVLIDQLWVR